VEGKRERLHIESDQVKRGASKISGAKKDARWSGLKQIRIFFHWQKKISRQRPFRVGGRGQKQAQGLATTSRGKGKTYSPQGKRELGRARSADYGG